MEALASGLPVLVSDIPGNREWIHDGMNGWLFPDGDAEALAARIREIMRAGTSVDRIRLAARKTAEERADWKRNAAELMRVYDLTSRL
jgi:glycosyltransferase involved in cell wall biosynthesis